MRDYKYEPLCKYLTNLKAEVITLSFTEINQILDSDLPPCLTGFGYNKSLLWNNNPQNHATRSWLEAGYVCIGYDKNSGSVTFKKTRLGNKQRSDKRNDD